MDLPPQPDVQDEAARWLEQNADAYRKIVADFNRSEMEARIEARMLDGLRTAPERAQERSAAR